MTTLAALQAAPPTVRENGDRYPVSVGRAHVVGDLGIEAALDPIYYRARIIVTADDRLLAWTTPDTDPVLAVAFDPAESSLPGYPGADWYFRATDGSGGMYVVRGERGCRCGELARWQPFVSRMVARRAS